MKGSKLQFISQILRDGSSTITVPENYVQFMQNDNFKMQCLSITEKTWIASCMNSFVVRIKDKSHEEIH
jgi:hypothetical protein